MNSMSPMEVRERLRDLEGLDRCLASELSRLSDSGEIGTIMPAGAARTAMLGAGLALQDGDFLFGTSRDLPAALARGVALDQVFAQILGREGDPSLGRGLPGAYNDLPKRTSLTDGNVGSHLVHACGYGLAARLRGADSVAVGLFGNAAQGNGEIHGALNFAGVYDAQVIFVARGDLAAAVPFAEAAKAWGIPVVTVRGDAGSDVYEAVVAARARAVAGEGPTIVDARLTAAWEPVDARLLQVELGDSGRESETVRKGRYQSQVAEALGKARQALPVGIDTMMQGLFSAGGGT